MKKLLKIFLQGAFTLAPIVLTLYILFFVFRFTDGLFKGLLLRVGFYIPGLGVLVTLIVVFLTGLLTSLWLTNKLIHILEQLFLKIPLLGSICGTIKDTISSFSSSKNDFGRLVRIDLPNGIKVLGFLTNDEENEFIPEGYVAVYVMQSMQWAGNLVLVPKNMVQLVESSTEESLRFIASAGLLKRKIK